MRSQMLSESFKTVAAFKVRMQMKRTIFIGLSRKKEPESFDSGPGSLGGARDYAVRQTRIPVSSAMLTILMPFFLARTLKVLRKFLARFRSFIGTKNELPTCSRSRGYLVRPVRAVLGIGTPDSILNSILVRPSGLITGRRRFCVYLEYSTLLVIYPTPFTFFPEELNRSYPFRLQSRAFRVELAR